MTGSRAQDLVFLVIVPRWLMQPAILDSVSAGIGSPFYVETVHRKAESIACLNPESLPPGNILSATCKAPQAVRKGGMDKDITEGILDFWRAKGPTPIPQRMNLQQMPEWEVSNAAMATIMYRQRLPDCMTYTPVMALTFVGSLVWHFLRPDHLLYISGWQDI